MRHFTFLIILFSSPFIASAQTTWHVPDDFPTIQGAISDSTVLNGDTVIVRPGTYVENIDFLGKAITLKSEEGAAVTTIDGGIPLDPDFGSTLSFSNGEGSDSVLEGFTITNGSGTYKHYTLVDPHVIGLFGGGIFCSDSSPTIKNNTIAGNVESVRYGAGIFCIGSSPIIANNTITMNVAGLGDGGGIYCWDSSPAITHNIITENYSSKEGGGIYCWGSSPNITENTITGNTAHLHSGGGIFCRESSPNIMNNTIAGNFAGLTGGGIECLVNSSPVITNNTITGNIVVFSYYGGGGIHGSLDSSPIITNTILWDNMASTGPELYIGTLTIRYCDVKGGQSSVWVYPGGTLHWGAGMIDSDPLHAEPGHWDDSGTPGDPDDDLWVNGDYHITFNSPCRDSGTNGTPGLPLLDFEGDPRIYQSTVDMGADEFHPHLYYTGEAAPSGTIQAKFVGLPGTSINGVILGFNIFDPPLPCDYGLWYMDNPMQIITGLGAIPSTGIASFPGTLPANPPAPYTIYLQGVIDMGLTNLSPVNVR